MYRRKVARLRSSAGLLHERRRLQSSAKIPFRVLRLFFLAPGSFILVCRQPTVHATREKRFVFCGFSFLRLPVRFSASSRVFTTDFTSSAALDWRRSSCYSLRSVQPGAEIPCGVRGVFFPVAFGSDAALRARPTRIDSPGSVASARSYRRRRLVCSFQSRLTSGEAGPMLRVAQCAIALVGSLGEPCVCRVRPSS